MLLVTGITGHSGKHFYNELVNNHYQEKIRFVVRPNSNYDYLNEKNSLNKEIVLGNLKDKEFLEGIFEGVSTLFHIASIFYSINLVDEALKHNVKRFILVHTTGIYSKYRSASYEYQEIELKVKELIENSGKDIELIILRPTMIFGYLNDRNISVFIKLVDTLKILPIVNHGEGLIQPVHGSDLGLAYYQILVTKGILKNEYILSGQRVLTMRELFEDIAKYLNVKRYFINVPVILASSFAFILRFTSFGKIDYYEKTLRLVENRDFDHQDAENDFGYSPDSFNRNLKKEVLLYVKSKDAQCESRL